jgi:hypothetical protein
VSRLAARVTDGEPGEPAAHNETPAIQPASRPNASLAWPTRLTGERRDI